MFHLGEDAWSIALRTAIIYVAMLGGFRLAGKRELGQMTPFDLVVILLIANAVQNAMVGHDVSVTGGLIAAAVLLVGNYGLAIARHRIRWLRRIVEGKATPLVSNGKFIEKNLRHEEIDKDEILMAMREHGIGDIKDIELAVLETDGSISVVPVEGATGIKRPHRTVRFLKHG